MLFNSAEYVLFLPIVVFLYFMMRAKHRWIILLAASYYFYMSFKPEYGILLLTATLISYIGAILISKSQSQIRKKSILIASLTGNLLILFYFKYANFIAGTITGLYSTITHREIFYHAYILLPIGISFYILQASGYLIDVYDGKTRPERHFGIFAVFVSFFPQLVAGPIERGKNLLPQFFKRQKFDQENIRAGLILIFLGFFKKIVIADRIGSIVDVVYEMPGNYSSLAIWIATVFFAFQIYCDFSGYSDIAIGSARLMGYRLMTNFKRPFFAQSAAQFWRRWHISLSTWFRDYVYIPLGGSQVTARKWVNNILIVFLISGLWHGANWTFFLWGVVHALYFIFSVALSRRNFLRNFLSSYQNIKKLLLISITFSITTFFWIFFRSINTFSLLFILRKITLDFFNLVANNFVYITAAAAGIILLFSLISRTAMLKFDRNLKLHYWKIYLLFCLGIMALLYYFGGLSFLSILLSPVDKFTLIVSVASILILVFYELIQEQGIETTELISKLPIYYRWPVYYLGIILILLFGVFRNIQFIYFQF